MNLHRSLEDDRNVGDLLIKKNGRRCKNMEYSVLNLTMYTF